MKLSKITLSFQVIIITGGNTGLGAEVAKVMAAKGATLILACRLVLLLLIIPVFSITEEIRRPQDDKDFI